MAYSKTTWVDNTTPIDKDNLNKIEQGIYDNSLVVDAITNTLNPTDTETYKTAELTEGQITDVIGVSDIVIKGQTSQNGEPTPATPQEIHCVKGNNVVKISNGSEETDYKLNLGNIELNAIEDFKDYFKKENGKWYKVEKIKSIIVDGTNYLSIYMFPNGTFVIYSNAEEKTLQDAFKSSSLSLFSNYLISKPYTAVFYNGEVGACFNVNTGEILANIGISTNREDINTWLSTHNLIIKYVLQTPDLIEITDTTLITQLEAIYNAPLYEETNITQTNNDLPMVLDITACKDNINGIKAFIRK